MSLDVEEVVNSGDATDHLLPAASEEQLDLRVLMEWVTRRVDQLTDITLERRNPVGIPVIQAEWKVDEFAAVAPG